MKLRASLFFLLLIVFPVASQTPAARKFDDFGDTQLSDTAARLDNFAIQLQNEPQMKAFVIAYRSRRDLPGTSSSLAQWLRNYLVVTRGFPSERIVAIDGGVANSVSQELWLVPPGATPAIRPDAYQRTIEDSSLHKFYEAIYSAHGFEPESYSFDISNSFEGFATALQRQPGSVGYLIAYAGVNTVQIGTYKRGREISHTRTIVQPASSARRELINEKASLVKTYRVPPTRLKTMFGGYREAPIMELWIGPAQGRAPVATPTLSRRKHR